MRYSLSQLQGLLRQAGWPDTIVNTRDGQAQLVPLMASVFTAESAGDPDNENCSTSRECSIGLAQINISHPGGVRYGYTRSQLHDPLLNLQVALRIFYDGGGSGQAIWANWGSFSDGSYIDRGQYNQSLALYYSGNVAQPFVAGVQPGSDQSIDNQPIDNQGMDQANGAPPIYEASIFPSGGAGAVLLGLGALVLFRRLL